MSRSSAPRSGQAGFTLLEVLVALLVLSIGLLGVAKMILASQKSNDDSAFSSKATILANAMLDDIRANFSNGNASNYAVANISTYAGTTNCFSSTGCTSNQQQITASDLLNWKTAVTTTLPGGTGSIAVSTVGSYPNSFTVATVTVTWNSFRANTAFENTCTSSSGCTTSVILQSIIQ